MSGLLKTAAVNLSKIANDLRLLSSGPKAGLGEITLPAVQAGSSIMPGKVNPVICEAVNQAAFQIISGDMAITLAAQTGQLELNAFLPLIAKNMFEMLDLLNNVLPIFIERCIKGIRANRDNCSRELIDGYTVATALTEYYSYDKASEVAGTTTDPVYKAMELLPIGPFVFVDTAGLDDTGELGKLRVERTCEVLRKCNLALVVVDINNGITEFEAEFIEQLDRRKIPSICILNKSDAGETPENLKIKF